MTIVEPNTMGETGFLPFMGVSGILELILALIGLWMVLSGFGVEQAVI